MQTQDHHALAKAMTEQLNIGKWKKAAFRLGNVEPDFNRFTYMGRKKEHFANGHSYECRKKEIVEFLDKPYQDTVWWWHRAGIVFHYLTDSFSRPHNPEFGYSSKDHVKYGIALHDIVKRAIKGNPWKIPEVDRDLKYWLEARHTLYMDRTKGIQDDCYYIYTTVMAVWKWVVTQKLE